MLTFIHDYDTIGSNGTVRYFKLRDQYYGEGLYNVFVVVRDIGAGMNKSIPMKMYKVYPDKDSDEYFLVPTHIALEGVEEIPEKMKSVRQWEMDTFWFLPIGDMEAINKRLYGIDIHGHVEHNGEEYYKYVQEVSPTGRIPKFNASNECFNLVPSGQEIDGEIVYNIKIN